MAEYTIQGGLFGDSKKPVREPVPEAEYLVRVVSAQEGKTREQKPRLMLRVEFVVLHDKDLDDTYKGRRIWQNYILEAREGDDSGDVSRKLLTQLLDAVKASYTEKTFDSEDLLHNKCWVRVRHRKGKPDGDDVRRTHANVAHARAVVNEPPPTDAPEISDDDLL